MHSEVMELRGLRYFIGFVVVIGLLIFLFVLIFGGGDNKSKVPSSSRTLTSYAESESEASLTIDGIINSAEEHRQVKITVDRNQVLFQIKRGYNGEVIDSRNFPNTTASYSTFLHALDHAGFTKGDIKNKDADERGYCPLGKRYILELKDGGERVERFWATSCGKPKTFLGDLGLNISLFQRQVPDYYKLSNNVQL
jgi:hypothetical protein